MVRNYRIIIDADINTPYHVLDTFVDELEGLLIEKGLNKYFENVRWDWWFMYYYCKTCGMPIHNEDGYCWGHRSE